MAIEHALKFLKKMTADNAFADKVMEADHVELRKILSASGWAFTEDELFLAAEKLNELSDEELDTIAGGVGSGRQSLPQDQLEDIGGKLRADSV